MNGPQMAMKLMNYREALVGTVDALERAIRIARTELAYLEMSGRGTGDAKVDIVTDDLNVYQAALDGVMKVLESI